LNIVEKGEAVTAEEWTQGGFYMGSYGRYVVHGFKFIGPHGEVGWHTKS
jgi:hypothetical protein